MVLHSKSRSTKFSRDVVHVNCVRTVRMQLKRKQSVVNGSGELKSVIGSVTYTIGCMESRLESIGEKLCHMEQSLSRIVNTVAIEEIVMEVVQAERARCNEEPSSYRYWLECTISMCGLKRFHRRLHMCSKIFIPLRDNMDDHWFLLVINLHEHNALMLDSLPDANSVARRMHHATDVLHLLDKVFEDEMKLYMPCGFHFATLPWATGEIFPIQTNDFDCGVFVIRNMQHFRGKWNAKYVSEDHRASLTIECVRHQRNELDIVKSMIQQCLHLGGNLEPVVHLLSSDCI